MLTATETSANLYHQLLQREMNTRQQRNPRAFAAHLFRERFRLAKNLYKTDLRAHYGCVNAIEFSNGGKYLASGGDDKRVLIWEVEKALAGVGRPRVLDTEHASNIFCLGFDRHNRKILSGGNDDLVIVHDFETGKLDNVFKHDNPVYGLSIDPQCDSIFATACENGQILVFDQRVDPADPFVVAQMLTSFHAVEFHPAGGNFLVTANSKRGAAFWDIRKPNQPVIQYGYVGDPPSCMSVRFNYTGNLILALRRRLPPILYNTQSPEPICTFYHGNYYNSCTMKSCTFAGEDDEFVLSGSDDFNLYVWRVSDVDLESSDQWVETTQMVLYGHRSIVNQVRYNRQKCILASSGVEKIVKLWSPFAQCNWSGSLLNEATCSDNPRELYSPYNFTSMSTPHSWSHMSHDYSSRNTNEDPRMMAFFDSLIQQEIEGWDTNSSTDSPPGSVDNRTITSSSASWESSNNSSTDDDDDDDDDDDNDNDDDDDNNGDNNDVIAPVGRRNRLPKRQLTRKKIDQFHRNNSSFVSKVKVHQRHKYTNRIAYLIATKRNTLRRLAIKGASLSNRRPYKIIKVGRRAKTNRVFIKSVRKRCTKRLGSLRSSEVPSTSAAAAAAVPMPPTTNYRTQRKRFKKHRLYDTSSEDDSSNLAASSSSRSTAPHTPSINAVVPSTSTGITSSLKDDIIRLRRQQQHIIDSDEDDDTDEQFTQPLNDVRIDRSVQPTKKLNGVRRANDAIKVERYGSVGGGAREAEAAAHDISMQGTNIRPMISAALNIEIRSTLHGNTTTTTTLPQTSTCNKSQYANKNSSSGNSNSNNNNNTNNTNTILNAGSSNSVTMKRRRPHMDIVSNCSPNSRLSNSSFQDDFFEQSASSSSDMSAAMATTNGKTYRWHSSSPLKRRKLSISDYINVRNDLNGYNNNDDDEDGDNDDAIEKNNNEQNNNNIFSPNYRTDELAQLGGDESATQPVGERTPQRRRGLSEDANAFNHVTTMSSSNSNPLLFTPDSGISVATATPGTCRGGPSGRQYNEHTEDAASTSRPLLSPCIEGDDEGVVVVKGSSSKTAINLYQQKMKRVRRNYRKKFADDTDSD